MRVDLVYFEGCAQLEAAREALRRALEGTDLGWTEWNQDDAGTPESLRRLPSPTVLVDGRAVGEVQEGTGRACSAGGAPPVELIRAALAGRPGSLQGFEFD